jgi:tripartite ATP-independent transporter DctM subunit
MKITTTKYLAAAEYGLSIAVLALMSALPLAELVWRTFAKASIGGTIPVVQHLTVWIAFLGVALAAGSDRLLSLATSNFLPERARRPVRIFTSFLAVSVAAWMVPASLELLRVERESADLVARGIPVWAAITIIPISFALVAVRMIRNAATGWRGLCIAALGLAFPVIVSSLPWLAEYPVFVPGLIVLLVAGALGMPIFAVFGGAAMLWFWSQGLSVAVVPNEMYGLSVSPVLPAIPLYALAGYILAEGGAGGRLLRALNAIVGWIPGGLAVVITLVLAFFTTLGSGVTILSMGGLILPLLVRAKYPQQTSVGLVTVGGSTGLLFPPSLPVILYAIKAQIPIDQLYLGGVVPGLLLVAVVALWSALQGRRLGAPRQPFVWREAVSALWSAKWELFTPVLILAGIFGGFATLVEAAATTVAYALVVECLIHRDISLTRDIPRIGIECATLVGGFLIIMGAALGLNNCLIQADIPTKIVGWVTAEITSPVLFLLALNGLLLVVGAIGETFSAIFVLVPLIAKMAVPYGIHPVHLGVIFLANMELGCLMPPMGANLFLSSYRFGTPLPRVWRATLPYLTLLVAAVLLITYEPWLTLAPVQWFQR